MTLTDEEGYNDFDEEFVFNGVKYQIEGAVTNTYGANDKCDHGIEIPNSGEYSRTVEVTSATFGTDNEFDVEDMALLVEIEKELDSNY